MIDCVTGTYSTQCAANLAALTLLVPRVLSGDEQGVGAFYNFAVTL